MSRIVDFYNVRPNDLRIGDVLICTVTLYVTQFGYQMYRCRYNGDTDDGIPQGDQLPASKELANSLFPVVGYAELKPDVY